MKLGFIGNGLELTLEQPIEFRVLRSLGTILDGKPSRRVTRLLNENLGETNHLGVVVQSLCQINHLVASILLCAGVTSRKELRRRRDSNFIALLAPTSFGTGSLPWRNGVDGRLGDARPKTNWCCGHGRENGE